MQHDSLRVTNQDVTEAVTIEVYPAFCDILCVRKESTKFQQSVDVHTVPLEQKMRPQIHD